MALKNKVLEIIDMEDKNEAMKRLYRERRDMSFAEIALAPWDKIVKMPELTLDVIKTYSSNIKVSDISFDKLNLQTFSPDSQEKLDDFFEDYKDEIDWGALLSNESITSDFIEKHKEHIDWEKASLTQHKIKDTIISDYFDSFNINNLMEHQTISDAVLGEKIDQLDIDLMCHTQKEMSEDFIRIIALDDKYANKLNWHVLKQNYEFSEEFKQQFNDQLYTIENKQKMFNDSQLGENPSPYYTQSQRDAINDLFDKGIDASKFIDPKLNPQNITAIGEAYVKLNSNLDSLDEIEYDLNIISDPSKQLTPMHIDKLADIATTKYNDKYFDIAKLENVYLYSENRMIETIRDIKKTGDIIPPGKNHKGNKTFYDKGFSRSQSNFLADTIRANKTAEKPIDITMLENKNLSVAQMSAIKDAMIADLNIEDIKEMIEANLSDNNIRFMTHCIEKGQDMSVEKVDQYTEKQKDALTNAMDKDMNIRRFSNPRCPAFIMDKGIKIENLIKSGINKIKSKFETKEEKEEAEKTSLFDWVKEKMSKDKDVKEIDVKEIEHLAQVIAYYAENPIEVDKSRCLDYALLPELSVEQKHEILEAYKDGLDDRMIKAMAQPSIDPISMKHLRMFATGKEDITQLKENIISESTALAKATKEASKAKADPEKSIEKPEFPLLSAINNKLSSFNQDLVSARSTIHKGINKGVGKSTEFVNKHVTNIKEKAGEKINQLKGDKFIYDGKEEARKDAFALDTNDVEKPEKKQSFMHNLTASAKAEITKWNTKAVNPFENIKNKLVTAFTKLINKSDSVSLKKALRNARAKTIQGFKITNSNKLENEKTFDLADGTKLQFVQRDLYTDIDKKYFKDAPAAVVNEDTTIDVILHTEQGSQYIYKVEAVIENEKLKLYMSDKDGNKEEYIPSNKTTPLEGKIEGDITRLFLKDQILKFAEQGKVVYDNNKNEITAANVDKVDMETGKVDIEITKDNEPKEPEVQTDDKSNDKVTSVVKKPSKAVSKDKKVEQLKQQYVNVLSNVNMSLQDKLDFIGNELNCANCSIEQNSKGNPIIHVQQTKDDATSLEAKFTLSSGYCYGRVGFKLDEIEFTAMKQAMVECSDMLFKQNQTLDEQINFNQDQYYIDILKSNPSEFVHCMELKAMQENKPVTVDFDGNQLVFTPTTNKNGRCSIDLVSGDEITNVYTPGARDEATKAFVTQDKVVEIVDNNKESIIADKLQTMSKHLGEKDLSINPRNNDTPSI